MARRPRNNSGLRELLIAEWDRSMKRWRIPGDGPCEHEVALKGGQAVGVSSETLLRAFMLAGLRCDDFAFGGRHYKTGFVLDENDRLIEVA